MDNSTKNKIKAYSLVASALAVGAINADAQVTKVTHSSTLDLISNPMGQMDSLDINGDQIYDFKFVTAPWNKTTGYTLETGGSFYIQALHKAQVILSTVRAAYANAYAPDELVDFTVGTINPDGFGMILSAAPSAATSVLPNNAEGFVGVRLLNSDLSYTYGWISLTVNKNPGKSLTIGNYAYNTTKGESLYAGSTIAGIDNNTVDAVAAQIFVNDKKEVVLNLPSTSAEILNMQGDVLLSSQSAVIDANSLTTGIYFVRVHSNSGVTTQKVFIR
jgi:hypothetical protein